MPIYEYACMACGHRLETMQKMSDAPLRNCPVCEESALHKLMSVVGVHIKGSRTKPTSAETMCGAGACPACLAD